MSKEATNQIIINGIPLDMKNIVRFIINSDDPTTVLLVMNKTLSSLSGQITNSVLPEKNTLEIKEDGVTIMYKDTIDSITCELTYNSYSDKFEEKIVLKSKEKLM